jgi:mannose-6-phosphate isomerase-like protein (cupin superfamily)
MQLHMPGLTSMTRLKVYDSLAPDGQRGGTPHVHLLCTETYYVLAGSGAVEMIDASGFSRIELRPSEALVFSPGTIHRLVNPNGDLQILVLMEHDGLPESGDNVPCFEQNWLADDAAFAEAMRVSSLETAYLRRDRGVSGFLALKATFEQDVEAGRAAYEAFLRCALERTAPFRAGWGSILKNEQVAANVAIRQLVALDDGDVTDLLLAQHALIPLPDSTRLGFCGHLHRYPAVFALEGTQAS